MSPDAYFAPLNGQSLLYPGTDEEYRGQCVMPVEFWIKENGVEPPRYPSASQYYSRGVPGYTQIPAGAPILEGDIVVFASNFPPANGNGHIDVASSNGSLHDYWAWDSNWSPPLKLSKIHHNGSDNNYIVGYLRLTKEEEMPIADKGFVINRYKQILGRDCSEQEIAIYVGKTHDVVYDALLDSDEFKARLNGGAPPIKLSPGTYQVN